MLYIYICIHAYVQIYMNETEGILTSLGVSVSIKNAGGSRLEESWHSERNQRTLVLSMSLSPDTCLTLNCHLSAIVILSA